MHSGLRTRRRPLLAALLTALLAVVGFAAPTGAAEVAVDAETATRDIVFPVNGEHTYSDTFGACRSGCERGHEGTDIMTPKLTPLVAATDATVTWLKDTATPDGSNGNYLMLRDSAGWEYWYIHINNDSPGTDDGANPKEWIFGPGIVRGATVKAGQLVGYAGDSGNAEWTGSHLHFEIHKPDGSVINPYKSLRAARHVSAPVADCTGTDTERYINSVHQLFLGRDAASAEVSRWCTAVAGGNRGGMTNALAASDEWAGARVTDLYNEILGRGPDPTGYETWTRKIANGYTLREIAIGIYGSPEYFERSGGTNRSYVDSLYRRILGRAPDQRGLDDWTSQLDDQRRGRTDVANGFYQSIESRRQRVTNLYQLILQRQPDPTGMKTWTERLVTIGDVRLAATLATSQEYHQRATRS